jgi:hypothetical protein
LVLAGSYYAYQRRGNSSAPPTVNNGEPVNSATPVSEPATPNHEGQAASGALVEEKKDEPVKKVIIHDAAKQVDQPGKAVERALKSGNAIVVPDPNRDPRGVTGANPPKTPAQPVVPEINAADLERLKDLERLNEGRGRKGTTSIRNLPDGTQIITAPDGSRVLTFPNGTQRIIRPGIRPGLRQNRRKN